MSTIDTALADAARRLADKMEFWAKNSPTIRPIVVEIEDLGGQCSITGDCLDISVSGNREKLLEVYRKLGEFGYRRISVEEIPEKATTISGYWEAEGQPKIWMFFSSSVCRRVQVGTKMEEVPVFDIVCDDSVPE